MAMLLGHGCRGWALAGLTQRILAASLHSCCHLEGQISTIWCPGSTGPLSQFPKPHQLLTLSPVPVCGWPGENKFALLKQSCLCYPQSDRPRATPDLPLLFCCNSVTPNLLLHWTMDHHHTQLQSKTSNEWNELTLSGCLCHTANIQTDIELKHKESLQ